MQFFRTLEASLLQTSATRSGSEGLPKCGHVRGRGFSKPQPGTFSPRLERFGIAYWRYWTVQCTCIFRKCLFYRIYRPYIKANGAARFGWLVGPLGLYHNRIIRAWSSSEEYIVCEPLQITGKLLNSQYILQQFLFKPLQTRAIMCRNKCCWRQQPLLMSLSYGSVHLHCDSRPMVWDTSRPTIKSIIYASVS